MYEAALPRTYQKPTPKHSAYVADFSQDISLFLQMLRPHSQGWSRMRKTTLHEYRPCCARNTANKYRPRSSCFQYPNALLMSFLANKGRVRSAHRAANATQTWRSAFCKIFSIYFLFKMLPIYPPENLNPTQTSPHIRNKFA